MTGMKRFTLAALVTGFAFFGLVPGAETPILQEVVATKEAEARIGRPLTPLSYAGVARRTSRRVARRTSVRLNALPGGCIYGPYYGANYWNCGGAYYQQQGNVYIQVVFD